MSLRLAEAALLAVVLAACGRPRPAATCRDLGGVWRAPDGARWMVLDEGATLAAYPLFDDARAPANTPADVVLAPRVLALARAPSGLGGEVRRRYMRRADACVARAPATVTSCADGALELVLGEPAAPLAFAPCTWPHAAPAHVERWRRE